MGLGRPVVAAPLGHRQIAAGATEHGRTRHAQHGDQRVALALPLSEVGDLRYHLYQ
jgi:hypothetical protein